MKLCPFRKYTTTAREYTNIGVALVATETFLECVGEECMAFTKELNLIIGWQECCKLIGVERPIEGESDEHTD